MEVTLLDALLLLWAVFATHKWLSYKEESEGVHMLLQSMLESEKLRDRIVGDFTKWKESRE